MNAIGAICAIPSDIKRHNLSLREAIRRSGYRQSRAQLGEADLASFLVAQPDLVESWLTFSVDKRTRRGWAIGRSDGAWLVQQPFSADGQRGARRFDDLTQACVAFILEELDFAVAVGDGRSSGE